MKLLSKLSNRIKVVLLFLLVLGTLIVLANKAKAAQYDKLNIDSVTIEKIEGGNVTMLEDSKNRYLFAIFNYFDTAKTVKTVYYYIKYEQCGMAESIDCKVAGQILKSKDLKTWTDAEGLGR